MTQTTEIFKNPHQLADDAFKYQFDLSPDERAVEVVRNIDHAKAWLAGLLRLAFEAGYKRGLKEAGSDLV